VSGAVIGHVVRLRPRGPASSPRLSHQLENPSSPIDMQTHAGSAFDNGVTLTFDLRMNACRGHVSFYGPDSSSSTVQLHGLTSLLFVLVATCPRRRDVKTRCHGWVLV